MVTALTLTSWQEASATLLHLDTVRRAVDGKHYLKTHFQISSLGMQHKMS